MEPFAWFHHDMDSPRVSAKLGSETACRSGARQLFPRMLKGCTIPLVFRIGIVLPGTGAIAADWKPAKRVELIVPTGPGSGVDNTARTLQAILQGKKLIDTPMSVINTRFSRKC